MKKKHSALFGIAVLLTAAMFTLGGCSSPTGGDDDDPLTPTAQMNAEDFPGVPEAAITTYAITDADSFDAAKAQIEASAGSYVLDITGTVDLGSDVITPKAGATVSLRGGGTLKKSSGTNAYLFELSRTGSKLILRDAVLEGHGLNDSSLVGVGTGTQFAMIGGTINGNNASNGGGVCVYNGGSFTMSDGTIRGNTAFYSGGGVDVNGGNITGA